MKKRKQTFHTNLLGVSGVCGLNSAVELNEDGARRRDKSKGRTMMTIFEMHMTIEESVKLLDTYSLSTDHEKHS